MMKKLHNFDSFINESINMRDRAEIVVHLKNDGFVAGEDYEYSTGTFMAKDMETAQGMADSVAGKFKCAIYDDRITKDGKVPMMIVK